MSQYTRVAESRVPQELLDRDLFKPARGGRCRHCPWSTTKKGFSGRQALRAHLKRHRIEKRAWRRPLLLQLLVVILVLSLGIAGWVGVRLPSMSGMSLPLVSLPGPYAGWATMGVSSVMVLMALVLMLWTSAQYGTRALARVETTFVVIAILVASWTVMGLWDIVETGMNWPMQVPIWVMLALTPALAAKAGRLRLLVKRRGVRSLDYVTFVKPKSEAAKEEIATWERERQEGTRKRRADRDIRVKCPECGSKNQIRRNLPSFRCQSCGTMLARRRAI